MVGFKLSPDDSFGDWELQKAKPGLAPVIRSIIKKLEEFIAVLWSVSIYGQTDGNKLVVNKADVELKPSVIKQFAAFGVATEKKENEYILDFPFSTKGLKLLAGVSAQNANASMRGWCVE